MKADVGYSQIAKRDIAYGGLHAHLDYRALGYTVSISSSTVGPDERRTAAARVELRGRSAGVYDQTQGTDGADSVAAGATRRSLCAGRLLSGQPMGRGSHSTCGAET